MEDHMLFGRKKAKKETAQAQATETIPAAAQTPEVSQNDEIIAVIAAAIAAIGADRGINLVVRSIERAPQTVPAWSLAGRAQRLSEKL
jgi:hypothetical protein